MVVRTLSLAQKVKPVDAVDVVDAYTTIPLHTASTVSTDLTFLDQRICPHHHIPLFHCIHCIHHIPWFDLFAPKTMSPPPYTTIPLHPLHPLSTGLTFFHQRQCSHHHIPPFHCVHCIYWFDLFAPKTMSPPPNATIPLHPPPLHPMVWPFCTKDECFHYHIPLYHCIQRIHCFDLFTPKTMSPILHTTNPLHPMCPPHTVSTAYCIHCVRWFDIFGPKIMSPPPYTTIPLHPLVWPFCSKDNVPITIYHYFTVSTTSIASTGLTFCTKDNVLTIIYHFLHLQRVSHLPM